MRITFPVEYQISFPLTELVFLSYNTHKKLILYSIQVPSVRLLRCIFFLHFFDFLRLTFESHNRCFIEHFQQCFPNCYRLCDKQMLYCTQTVFCESFRARGWSLLEHHTLHDILLLLDWNSIFMSTFTSCCWVLIQHE